MHTKEIRELAARYSAAELDACLNAEITEGVNACHVEGDVGDVVNTLAEAEFVRERVEDGASLPDAVRELARRMRAVQELGSAAGS